MRKIMNPQMKLGEVDVSNVELDYKSRDDIPRVLMGLKAVYMDSEAREELFDILMKAVPAGVDACNGRPGMDLWKIIVLATVRLGCDVDYDRLHSMANDHKTIREMMGLGWEERDYYFNLKTIKENVSLLTPEILERINEVVVKAGHRLIGKKKEDEIELKCKVDSFPVETDVHYPTDANLLFDAIRKTIEWAMDLAKAFGTPGWRQGEHLIAKLKKQLRKIEKSKKKKTKNKKKKAKLKKALDKAYTAYLDEAEAILKRAEETLSELSESNRLEYKAWIEEIEYYAEHARRQIDQIRRRALGGEKIPHEEKVFSIFQPHTEMIIKGKAGVEFELGLNVCVAVDQHQFVLHHKVMVGESDADVAVPILEEAKEKFLGIETCSYDRGFYTPENKEALSKIVKYLVMPRKGRPAPEESEAAFVEARHKHAGVESSINALEHRGLDRCRDSGLDGFKRYVALSVVGNNLHVLGAMFFEKENKRRKRIAKYNATLEEKRRKAA